MRTRVAVVFGFVVALAACSDTAGTPAFTAPDVAPSLALVASTDNRAMQGSSSEFTARPSEAVAPHAAAGARASGYAETVSIFSGAVSKYSFIVLTTAPSRIGGIFPAKGEVQGTITQVVDGTTMTETIHADINCADFFTIPLPIFGRMANASGPIKHWTRNGLPVPFPPGQEVLFTVQDNGEGAESPPDRASTLIPISGGRLACRDLFLRMFPSEQGNIQVVFPGERGNNQDER